LPSFKQRIEHDGKTDISLLETITGQDVSGDLVQAIRRA